MNKISFNNKAKNLLKIKNKGINVPYLKIFNCVNFNNNQNKILKIIQKNFKFAAVRSSSIKEDRDGFSNAGKFKSFLNVNVKNTEDLKNKILKVNHSYKSNNKSNIFFVQEMVKNIYVSGVVLTRDINTYSPYYIINYHKGSDSSFVTSGKKSSGSIKYFPNMKFKLSNDFNKLILVVKKLKTMFRSELDVEFVIDKSKKIYIVQVRPLKIPKQIIKDKLFTENYFKNLLINLEKKISKLKKKQKNLHGKTSFFGVMPDWNPAEIIGKKPRPLALSLYKELITDHIWSKNRYGYGFSNLGQFHLMTTFYGTPYIDVRIDFNSWLPRKLNPNIKSKLINYYLSKFKKNKNFHDKIEKEIIFTCYTFSTEKRIKKDLKNILSKKEMLILIHNLKEINRYAFTQKENDLKKIKKLIIKQNQIEKSDLYYFDKIYWHLEDCKENGTLPFAGLARCGFIAVELINSLVEEKIISKKEKDKFLSSIRTILTDISSDIKKLKKNHFIKKYGHLRPNSYEITSPNYKIAYKNFFKRKNHFQIIKQKFVFSIKQKKEINKFIKKTNFIGSFDNFIKFIKDSMQAREYSKFIFMKSIDLIFENLTKFGNKYGLKKNDLSYLNINDITELYFNLSSKKVINKLKEIIKSNKEEYLQNKSINLPDVIADAGDIYKTKIPKNIPSYITSNKCEGYSVFLKNVNKKILISNKIVCIESADPGFDFIFSHNIKGLVTKYGGYNSHMSIRCSELGLPAIIGVGERYFENMIKSKIIKIDCDKKEFEVK